MSRLVAALFTLPEATVEAPRLVIQQISIFPMMEDDNPRGVPCPIYLV